MVHLNIKAVVSYKHVCIKHAGKMRALYIYEMATQILTSRHPKLFSAKLLESNGAVWKFAFSARQNAENEHQ